MPTDAELLALRDPERGRRNLAALAAALGPDPFRELCHALARWLPYSPDPDLALNNLERLLIEPPNHLRLPELLAGQGRLLEMLLQLLGTSRFLADALIENPDGIGWLSLPVRRTPPLDRLLDELRAQVASCRDDAQILRAFRRFRRRQLLRVGVNDIIHDRPLEEVTADISRVAEAAIGVAWELADRKTAERCGEPWTVDGTPARAAVLAFGKLGGGELNYSSDIDLMFVYDREGQTRPRHGEPLGLDEFYGRAVGEFVRLLTAHTDLGPAYRVDLRLRPEGTRAPLARSLAATLSYYDAMGRTWERQALIKLRPVGGDRGLGREFLGLIEPFIYRKYFSFSEVNEIRLMKRKVERKSRQSGGDNQDVKAGHGGIRDIEFTIQFLQLLNGGDLPDLRRGHTLDAMRALADAGCLTEQEYQILDDAYRFLRRVEHRLQLLFDLQTHRLPTDPDELRLLARRMGYQSRSGPPSPLPAPPPARRLLDEVPPEVLDTRQLLIDPLDSFLHDYHAKTRLNRTILDHLLHFSFSESDAPDAPESDLILDPDPDPATVHAVLGKYGFRDIDAAAANLTRLGREGVRFLSTRRCRHFLAGIAPRLLRDLADTPDPDMALINLEKVTASLGAKAVLWELFSFNLPSLKLYVDLCANSQFLAEILVNNPGMVDELLDSLVLNRPRSIGELQEELAALCHGAEDQALILRSFQDKELLRIGVRDLLDKTPTPETAAALSDLAETILDRVVWSEEPAVQARFGTPRTLDGRPSRFAVLALGKLGGRELSYHSDLDLIFVYESEGLTRPSGAGVATDHLHYFTELARRVIKRISHLGPAGRLYAVDMRLRPTGRSGSLAVSLAEFARYYGETAQLWERLALTKARPVSGDAAFGLMVANTIRSVLDAWPWPSDGVEQVLHMRERLEQSRGERSLKRGPGGLADVEFLVQMLQLKHGRLLPRLRTPNTRTALQTLTDCSLLSRREYTDLLDGYDFQRMTEGRLRIVTNRPLDELPDDESELDKLALRLGYESGGGRRFRDDWRRRRDRVRSIFRDVAARERTGLAVFR